MRPVNNILMRLFYFLSEEVFNSIYNECSSLFFTLQLWFQIKPISHTDTHLATYRKTLYWYNDTKQQSKTNYNCQTETWALRCKHYYFQMKLIWAESVIPCMHFKCESSHSSRCSSVLSSTDPTPSALVLWILLICVEWYVKKVNMIIN